MKCKEITWSNSILPWGKIIPKSLEMTSLRIPGLVKAKLKLTFFLEKYHLIV